LETLVIGPSIEQGIASLRRCVAGSKRFRHLFLASYTARFAPLTGAKWLNKTAIGAADLTAALVDGYRGKRMLTDECDGCRMRRNGKAKRFN
jgi:hypothetical protein